MTKKRRPGAPASATDNGIRGEAGSEYTRHVTRTTETAFGPVPTSTVPDIITSQLKRKLRDQLDRFILAGDRYERSYENAANLLKDLADNKAGLFESVFTHGGAPLAEVRCEYKPAPDATNLQALKEALPKISMKRAAEFKVFLTKEQHAVLTAAYQDRAVNPDSLSR